MDQLIFAYFAKTQFYILQGPLDTDILKEYIQSRSPLRSVHFIDKLDLLLITLS